MICKQYFKVYRNVCQPHLQELSLLQITIDHVNGRV
jgi:hypothetical protein